MYNMIFGSNPDADQILGTIGLSKDDFYRYRDTHIEDDGTIAVYTRGGGGNRESWEDTEQQKRLYDHPNFLDDTDDDFDCTYCTLRFRPANEVAIKEFQNGVRGEALWPILFKALESTKG